VLAEDEARLHGHVEQPASQPAALDAVNSAAARQAKKATFRGRSAPAEPAELSPGLSDQP
jgi:hypothetical protein